MLNQPLTSLQALTETKSNTLSSGKSGYKDEDIKKVARQFEAMFAGMMLKTMNESVERSSLVPKSMGESVFNDMLMDEYAERMSKGKGMGLADLLYRSLRQDDAKVTATSNKIREYESKKYLNKTLQYTAGDFSAVKATPIKRSTDERMGSIESLIERNANKYGVDATLVKAVARQESGGNPQALSRAGAKGVMQLMDSTAKDMGVRNSYNPAENIEGGVKYLKKMLELFQGDKEKALAAYNAGPDTVKKYQGVPPYAETKQYVKNVLHLADQYAQKAGKE